MGDGVQVFLRDTVQLDKVYTNSYFSRGFRHIYSTGTPWASARLYNAFFGHLLKLLVNSFSVMEWDWTGWNFSRWCIASVDGVLYSVCVT